MDQFLEILQYSFFQKALMAGVVASICSGIIGSYIVIKRISLISGSISHSAFGGLGMSFYFGINPLYGALIFSLISASLIAFIRERAKNRLNNLLSITWAVGMAIGLIFIFLKPGYAGDLFSFLFGNILLVNSQDLWLMGGLTLAIVAIVYKLYNSLLAVTFNESFAKTRNIPVTKLYWILLLLISLTIVLLIRIVGSVLLIALLTLPSASAQMMTRSLKHMMLWSVLFALLATLGGLWLAYALNFPASPVIVLLSAGIYLLILINSIWKKRI